MKYRLVSPWKIVLIMGLAPAAESFGQSPPGNPYRQGNVGPNQALTLQGAIREAQGQPQNGPWLSDSHALWRNLVLNPSSQDFTLAWFDATSRNSGMTLAPADPALRAHLNLPKDTGLIVTALEQGSPAFAAGIRQNDILIRIGEDNPKFSSLAKPQDLEEGLKAAGDQPVSLIVLRGGKRISLKVQPRVRVSLGPVHPEPPTYWIGVSATPLEPALRSQLQVPDKQGLIAMEVVKDGPAAKAGVQRYDILLKFDGIDLTDQGGLTSLVQSRGERIVDLELFREGHKQEIKITPERRKASVTLELSKPQTGQFDVDVLLPAAVVSGQDARLGRVIDILPSTINAVVDQESQQVAELFVSQTLANTEGRTSAGKSTEQRLDELTAQIKELRQAVESLSKVQEKK